LKILEQTVNEFISIHENVHSLLTWLRAAYRGIVDEAKRKLAYDFAVRHYVHIQEVIWRCYKQELFFGDVIGSSGSEA
jgi:hypothetical protein